MAISIGGDFVLTTFTPIRTDMEAIGQCIRDLADCKIAALAIKSIYVTHLPEDVLAYANREGLPIFLFDEGVYFEDIIEDLINGMQARSFMDLLEAKVDALYRKDLRPAMVLDIARDINRQFLESIQVVYMKAKGFVAKDQLIQYAERYLRSRHRSPHYSLVPYEDGLMVFLTGQDLTDQGVQLDLDFLMRTLGIDADQYMRGYSAPLKGLGQLDTAVKQAVYATMACDLEGVDLMVYGDLGIYKLLLPASGNVWVRQYMEDVLTPIRDYDGGKLLETARTYIGQGGDVVATAEAMYQHKNTIRYRLQKMKTLLACDQEGDFYEQLSIAIKCEQIMKMRKDANFAG